MMESRSAAPLRSRFEISPADRTMLPTSMIGIRHVPLAALSRGYSIFASKWKGLHERYCCSDESPDGPLLPTPHRSRAGSYQGSSCRVGDWPDGRPGPHTDFGIRPNRVDPD